ncbi:MAG: GDSL-type esterase/lipase family protein [Phycisphaerae bacterium]|jgi:lysophospholipase L1-like esterase
MNLKSVLIGVILLCVFCAAEVEYPSPERWANDAKVFAELDAKNSFPENEVLFVGSSSIRNWKTADAFKGFKVINRGFGGTIVADCLYYAEPFILKYKPRVVVLYAGDNDCSIGIPVDNILRDFVQLEQKIHEKLPCTQIICLGIKLSVSRENCWPAMRKVNELYANHCSKTAYLTYFDVDAPLKGSGGRPKAEYYLGDNLHLTDAGYAVWNSRLLPVLTEKYILASISQEMKK